MFKKSEIGPKIVEQYGGLLREQSQWIPNNHSPMTERSSFFIPAETCSSNIIHDSSFDTIAHRDWKCMQFLAEEVLGSFDPQFHNSASLAYVPSEVRYRYQPHAMVYIWEDMELELAVFINLLFINFDDKEPFDPLSIGFVSYISG